MSTENIQEEYIRLITMKMNYNIFKTSKKDEFDYLIREEREMCKFRANAQRRIQNMLSHIELILEEIDRILDPNPRYPKSGK